MALRRSCHPTQLASPSAARAAAQLSALPVAQQCTQMPRNGVERPFSPICVHYCVPTGRPRDPRAATVYTNAPKRLREAVFGDLCTLLRPPASPRGVRMTLTSQQCTQMPKNGSDRPFSAICVHSCVTTGRPRDPAPQLSAQQCTQMAQNSSERPFSAICVHYCVPTRSPAQPSRSNSVHNHEAPNIPALGRRTSPRSG